LKVYLGRENILVRPGKSGKNQVIFIQSGKIFKSNPEIIEMSGIVLVFH